MALRLNILEKSLLKNTQAIFSHRLIALYSSLSSRNDNHSSQLKPSFGKDEFDSKNGGYDRLRQIGEKSGVFNHLASSSMDDCKNGQRVPKFDEVDENEESDDVENDDVDEGDDEFMVLNSYDRNHKQREDMWRTDLGEDEFRHPLVKEICRLIEGRSVWNPKREGELKHLLRSLKPSQVCAVLHSQADERVALKFFYWADRQWRYRHDPIVYYAMLEVLSKTKLCQGAKRILRLMARRGIERRPEAFGYVMVSYSRAGNLRNAMRVLTTMQRAGVGPDLSICNTAIHVLVMGNRLEKAFRFLDRMQLVGITPNVVTYNCLIKGYCDVHRVEDAMQLITDMPLKGCSPDKVSYYNVTGFFL